jgi:Eukaryotic initiation factor 4E
MTSKANLFSILDDEEDNVVNKDDGVIKKYYKNYTKTQNHNILKKNNKSVSTLIPTEEIFDNKLPNYYKIYTRHINYDKNWNNILGFNNIYTITTWRELIKSINTFDKNINTCNFNIFIMKNEISPMWEDNENRRGSRTNIKIESINECTNILKLLLIFIVNNSLFIDEYNSLDTIQGITFNPKKHDGNNYYIIQIWYKINFTDKYYKNNNFINKDVLKILENYSVYTRKQKPEF